MEFNEMINNILYTVLTVITPVITYYLVSLVKSKIQESGIIKQLTENENLQKLVSDATDSVLDAVVYVNQIYVDALKKEGKFDENAQKEAFNRAYVESINMISDGSKKAIEQLYGAFDKWLQLKIETAVNVEKKN